MVGCDKLTIKLLLAGLRSI